MRIIAGEFRGRKLLPPEDEVTRPVTDRVKQSLFDILAPQIEGVRVYDCFAGTGSMGLECLSRGAAHVTFFEAHHPALARLKKNVATLGVGDRSALVTGDLFRWFKVTKPADRAHLVFLDPPYRFLSEHPGELRELATAIAQAHLWPQGTVVFRHDAGASLDLAPLVVGDRREYGGMVLEFLRSVEGTAPRR